MLDDDEETYGHKRRRKYKSDSPYNLGLCWCPFLMVALLFIAGTLCEEILFWFSPPQDFTPEIEKLDFIFANSNSDSIIDIIMTTSVKCPDLYRVEAIGYWPGTAKGCYCEESDTLFPGDCTDSDCRVITQTVGVPLYLWRGRRVCVLRGDYILFKNPTTTCPNDYKTCTNTVCVPNAKTCPLTMYKLVD